MLLDILKGFNWLDVAVVIFMFRIVYIAMNSGLPIELFKLLGTILAIYLSLHYYTNLSDYLGGPVPYLKNMPLDFLDFVCFIILAVLGYIIFVFLREGFSHFIKMEAVRHLNKYGGMLLGIIRSFLFTGLLIFILAISTISYLGESVKSSSLGNRFFKITPIIYSFLWNNVMSKFMTGEKFNSTVFEVKNKF
ncbi:MAG: CvpA family protein [Candidatus Omnitrophota bacterium]